MSNEQLKQDIAQLTDADLFALEVAIHKRIKDASLSYKSYRETLQEVAQEHLAVVEAEMKTRGLR